MKAMLKMVLAAIAALMMSTAAYAGSDRATVCHNGSDLRIAESAVDAHLAHGDTYGRCESDDDDQASYDNDNESHDNDNEDDYASYDNDNESHDNDNEDEYASYDNENEGAHDDEGGEEIAYVCDCLPGITACTCADGTSGKPSTEAATAAGPSRVRSF